MQEDIHDVTGSRHISYRVSHNANGVSVSTIHQADRPLPGTINLGETQRLPDIWSIQAIDRREGNNPTKSNQYCEIPTPEGVVFCLATGEGTDNPLRANYTTKLIKAAQETIELETSPKPIDILHAMNEAGKLQHQSYVDISTGTASVISMGFRDDGVRKVSFATIGDQCIFVFTSDGQEGSLQLMNDIHIPSYQAFKAGSLTAQTSLLNAEKKGKQQLLGTLGTVEEEDTNILKNNPHHLNVEGSFFLQPDQILILGTTSIKPFHMLYDPRTHRQAVEILNNLHTGKITGDFAAAELIDLARIINADNDAFVKIFIPRKIERNQALNRRG